MADLPQSGLELIIKNAQKTVNELKAYNKSVMETNKVNIQAAKTGSNTSKALSSLNKDFSEMGKNVLSQIPGVGKLTNLLGGLGGAGSSAGSGVAAMGASMSAALPVIGAVAVAVAGITAGFVAFWKTGMRGAELQNSLEAFKNVIGGLEDTNTVLSGLRNATRGTVSDMELMRLTTATLQGQSQEFRQVLLKTENGVTNLGKVLDVTARAARATGQNEEYIREKFLSGLRLQSKLRLDDIGVTVNAVEANEKYAESIGKTAAALTDAEKKQAFLTEALSQLDRIGAEAPVNRVQDLVKQIGVAFQNLKDKIALLVQPIFAPVVEAVSAVVKRVEEGFNNLIYILSPIIKTIGAVFSEALQNVKAVWNLLFGDFDSSARSVMPYIIASFQIAGEAATGMIRAVGSAFRAFISALAVIRKAIGSLFSGVGEDVNLNINQLAFNLGKGGALIIGSFAAGILKAGTYVIQAVTAIAQIVADFLVGFSPPKKGPLANIDKGGENVAISWVDGFMGGVKSSFGQVTAYVNARLGAIAKLSREQVEARLAMLDVALRPFRENLAIVKADMEAIAGFTDPALRIMERQRKSLLKAFGEGKIGDVEQLRNLDRQIQRMKELKEFGQDQVDQAELKLALASSQQAQERALLQIMKDRLGAAEKASGAGGGKETGAGGGKETGAGGGGGGAGASESGAGAGLGLGGGETPDLLSTEAIDAAKAKILAALASVGASASAGIGEGLAESGFGEALAGFTSQGKGLAGEMARIAKSNPAQGIADKFAGLKDAVSGAFETFATFIADTFKNLFSDPDGTVPRWIDIAKNKLTSVFSGEGVLGIVSNAFTTFKESVDSVWKALFSDPDGVVPRLANGVKTIIENIFSGDGNPLQTGLDTLDEIKTQVGEIFTDVFDMDVSGSAETIYDKITEVFEGAKNLAADLINTEAVQSIKTTIEDAVSGVLDGITNIDVPDILKNIGDLFTGIANTITAFPTGALKTLSDIASGIGGLVGIGGGDGEDAAMPALQAMPTLDLELPEELRQQLHILGANITGAIATGMKSDDLLPITEALGAISTRILNTFSTETEGSPLLLAQSAMTTFTANIGTSLSTLRDTIGITLDEISAMLTNVFVSETGAIAQSKLAVTTVIDSIINDFARLTNTGDGTLSGALQNMRGVLRSTLVIPVHEAAQAAANAIINALNSVIDQYNGLGLAAAPSINRLTPIFMQPPSFAKGTLGYNRPFIAGEGGKPELVMPARNSPLSVFPNKATSALTAIAGMMNKPAPQPTYIPAPAQNSGGGTSNIRDSYNSNKNLTVNARQKMTRLEILQLLSRM